MADVEKVSAANPGQELHIYGEAGHAFTNDARPSFHARSSELAEQRMFRFIDDCCSMGRL
jgi:dienelactone hydrolase